MKVKEVKDLTNAVQLLENPGFAIKAADLIGSPIEKLVGILPESVQNKIGLVVQKAILGALKLSLKTMHVTSTQKSTQHYSSNWWHKVAVATSGGVAGFFGIAATAFELPISTTIMMRSIADVARSEGADISNLVTQLECVQILAFGGISKADDAAEVGYFIAREAMTKVITDAATYISQNGLAKEGAPAIVRFIIQIAERYSITVTEKAAAQAVPVIGSIGGALINTLFIDHFQDMAKAHFSIRRLESHYGVETVKSEYIEIREKLRAAKG